MFSREKQILKAEAAIRKAESLELSGDAAYLREAKKARAFAAKILKKVGLSVEDISVQNHLILEPHQMMWEKALGEMVFCFLGTPFSSDSKGVYIQVPSSDFNSSKETYSRARKSVLQASGVFTRKLKMTVDLSQITPVSDAFCNFAVLGVAQRLLDSSKFFDVSMPELDKLISDPGPAHIEHQSEAPSGYRGGRYKHRPVQVISLSPGPAGLDAANLIVRHIR